MLKKTKRTQINYINNRNSLINIEQLEIKIKDAFLLGLGVGVLVGLTTALYLSRKERS